jgi:hypothetical protein
MKIGEIKKEQKFAWFPELMDNGKTVWLDYYMNYTQTKDLCVSRT